MVHGGEDAKLQLPGGRAAQSEPPHDQRKVSKSESSHKDLSSRVGRIEEQLTETNQTLSKLTKMMEVMLAGNNVEKSENSNSARSHGNPPRRNQDQAPAIPEEILEEARLLRGVGSFEQQLQNFPIFNGDRESNFEVMNFFLRSSGKPFDEFKRVQQQDNSAKKSVNSESTLSLEQKRAKGLCYCYCYKCGEKFFQGQKCSNQNYPKSKAMEFEGRIGVIPIIALMVSGSTHSFLKPTIAQKLKLQVTHTNPLILQTANDTRVQTNSLCRSQKFELQEQEFEANLRLLEIPDYDMILGSDWIAQFGTMCMDLGKGIVKMKHKGKNIQLAIGKKLAEVEVCEQEPEILHLFCMEEVKS